MATPIHFHTVHICFCVTTAELSDCNGDPVVCNVENIYLLYPLGKSLLTPGVIKEKTRDLKRESKSWHNPLVGAAETH